MLFNSYVFAAFFAVVFSLYWASKSSRRIQNAILLVASYVFYGWWDWRFLSLIVLSTAVDFAVGNALGTSTDAVKRKRLVTVSLLVNLGLLGVFKYFNFFADSFADMIGVFGLTADFATLNIVLPVGISFYTFQTLSYSIDVYRRRMDPCRDLLDFALFVGFFPQLVAGPIERASRLIPQITQPRSWQPDEAYAGVFLVIWGLFKKVVVADNLATIANAVFSDPQGHSGLNILIGALAFTMQIYGDFSGYSDIARGISKLFGFDLMVNFKLPYFARDPSDFWRRWHVSLSTWLRDYLYIGLGGNRGSNARTYRNLFLTMLLGGLWHGAAWNFVLWGVYHGLLLIAYRPIQGHVDAFCSKWYREAIAIAVFFVFTVFGWVLFRADSMEVIAGMVTNFSFAVSGQTLGWAWLLLYLSAPVVAVMVWQQKSENLLAPAYAPLFVRVPFFGYLAFMIVVEGSRMNSEFIYFQF